MAHQFYVKCKGKKQGQFKGEGIRDAWLKEWQEGHKIEFSVSSPRDISTGQASGKRQYKPITFVKEWGASSPQYLQACANNEVCDLEFNFVHTTGEGQEEVYYVIKLTNATISSVKQFTEVDARSETNADTYEKDEISVTFQKIEHEHKIGKTMFVDDWAK